MYSESCRFSGCSAVQNAARMVSCFKYSALFKLFSQASLKKMYCALKRAWKISLFLCEAKYAGVRTKIQHAINTVGYLLEK